MDSSRQFDAFCEPDFGKFVLPEFCHNLHFRAIPGILGH